MTPTELAARRAFAAFVCADACDECAGLSPEPCPCGTDAHPHDMPIPYTVVPAAERTEPRTARVVLAGRVMG